MYPSCEQNALLPTGSMHQSFVKNDKPSCQGEDILAIHYSSRSSLMYFQPQCHRHTANIH